MSDASSSPLLTRWRAGAIPALSPEQARAIAVEMGLDERGFPLPQSEHWDVDDYEDQQPLPPVAPWGGPATMLDDVDEDDDRTVLEALADAAEAQGMSLTEWLGTQGIGPEAEPDDY